MLTPLKNKLLIPPPPKKNLQKITQHFLQHFGKILKQMLKSVYLLGGEGVSPGMDSYQRGYRVYSSLRN